MNEILRDRERASIRLVMNPDRMVIREAQRTFTYLNLYGYLTDAVLVNRVFPDDVAGGYFDSWRERQQENLRTVVEGFSPVPVLTARYFDQEVVGAEMLDRLGDELFAGEPAHEVLHHELAHELTSVDGRAELRLPIPFTTKGELKLSKVGQELIVAVGREKRTIILPSALARHRPAGAGFDDGTLTVTFTDERTAPTRGPDLEPLAPAPRPRGATGHRRTKHLLSRARARARAHPPGRPAPARLGRGAAQPRGAQRAAPRRSRGRGAARRSRHAGTRPRRARVPRVVPDLPHGRDRPRTAFRPRSAPSSRTSSATPWSRPRRPRPLHRPARRQRAPGLPRRGHSDPLGTYPRNRNGFGELFQLRHRESRRGRSSACPAAAALAAACPSCGTENPPGAKFCIECGTALAGEAAPPHADRAPAPAAPPAAMPGRPRSDARRRSSSPTSPATRRSPSAWTPRRRSRWSTARCSGSARRSSATAAPSTSTSATT